MPSRSPKPTAAPWVPDHGGLSALQQASKDCEGCDLFKSATQTVFGEGPAHPDLMLVGEQPGDKEDLAGHPFVGPAGRVLDEALAAAGIDRRRAYVTNVVKHFKWERGTGQRRIHAKPNQVEIQACRPWLEAELTLLRPRIVVCLGATAVQAVLGKQYQVLRDRGKFFPHPLAEAATITIHPSAILRAQTPEERQASYQAFVRDLTGIREKLMAMAGAA